MSLVARHLEVAGLPTVIIGSALDVVEHCGVPRFVFTDFPLGNPCGPPDRRDIQRVVVGHAVRLLAEATAPRTTLRMPFAWHDPAWRARYGRVDPAERARLLEVGRRRRAAADTAKESRTKGRDA
ncbi:MAG: hypothetical protein ACOY4R_13575 [Pseudomonadota bacterium]